MKPFVSGASVSALAIAIAAPAAAQDTLRGLLHHGEAECLWSDGTPGKSGYDEDRQAPFNRAIHVFDGGVP